MANCQRYMDKKGDSISRTASDIDDHNLKVILRAHKTSEFWERPREPDELAYVRRWVMMVRREARKRGML